MRFLEFKEKLNKFIVFSINDIRKIKADFDLRRLNEWQKKGYIRMVRRGYYVFTDLEINELVLFLIANKIYSPSYISLEMAFAYYNLIPESVYGITSVTSQKTDSFKTPLGEFIYRHIKPDLMFGYKLVEFVNHNFKIAEPEKAILDYFYLNPHIKNQADFSELRFNIDEFKTATNQEKLTNYLAGFNNKSLERRVKKFIKYLNA